MSTISVIGAGAWGTALAQMIANTGKPVTLWARGNVLASNINAHRENKDYLAGYPLNQNVTASSDLKNALKSDILLMVTPAQYMRDVLSEMKPFAHENHALILCSKGIEISTGKLMSEVAAEILPKTQIAVLSGPNFAHEIAAGKPAATTIACHDEKTAQRLQQAITSPVFRPYITNDVIGAQIAGALKNVIAIACGMSAGMDMGENARAALVTRGLAEIARLGHAMGAQYETFLGLSGVGDLMLCCASSSSRNFAFGHALGSGKNIAETLKSRKGITEGVHTAQAAVNLATQYQVEMPISLAVHNCVNKGLTLDEAMHAMLNRPVGHEL